jgi:hypothetical protein
LQLIHQNPFRILGLPITATDREITKRVGDLGIYVEMGKQIEYNSDNYFPIKPVRTTKSVLEAKQKIEQPEDKLFYSLFWFWEHSNNTTDEMAFYELKNGNVDKALSFWNHETTNEISSQNNSNFKNQSVLQLGLSTSKSLLGKNHFLNSITLSGYFHESKYYNEYATQVLKYSKKSNSKKLVSQYVDEVITSVKNSISPKKSNHKITHAELLNHFNVYSESIQSELINKFSGNSIHSIESEVTKAIKLRKKDSSTANKTGLNLYKITKNDLEHLLNVLSKTDLKYQLIADKLAEELIDCSIAYFNKFRDTKINPGNDALKLAILAKEIAFNEKIIERINNGLPILEEYVEDKNRFTCNVCHQYCENQYQFEIHKKNHSDKVGDTSSVFTNNTHLEEENEFECSICGQECDSIADLKKHGSSLHTDNLKSLEKHQCSICDQEFTSIRLLKYHFKKNHTEKFEKAPLKSNKSPVTESTGVKKWINKMKQLLKV